MRPILVLLAAKLYNEICPATLHAAVALELLHTASLVHDDVVDESTERRGQLSVNAVFNNKVAVLTGDYLLATALVEVGMTRNYGIIDIVSKLGQDLKEKQLGEAPGEVFAAISLALHEMQSDVHDVEDMYQAT